MRQAPPVFEFDEVPPVSSDPTRGEEDAAASGPDVVVESA